MPMETLFVESSLWGLFIAIFFAHMEAGGMGRL